MAWYNNASDLGSALSINNIKKQGSKAASDVYALAAKKPTQALYQSIKTGNAQPMKEYVGEVYSQAIKQPTQRLGGMVSSGFKNIVKTVQNAGGGSSGGGSSGGSVGPAPDYSKFSLNLTPAAGGAETASFTSLISGNENADAIRGNISQQYGALGSLAKLREGSQRQTEQSAIARRLAASGMSGSGAGMRMQQQTDLASGRRAAETQLALGSEQASAEARAQDAASGRNLQREGMRLNATQGESDRAFRDRQFKYQQDSDKANFDRDSAVIAENQKIAREVQRYNDAGLIGQLGQDIFGSLARKTSIRTPLGGITG